MHKIMLGCNSVIVLGPKLRQVLVCIPVATCIMDDHLYISSIP